MAPQHALFVVAACWRAIIALPAQCYSSFEYCGGRVSGCNDIDDRGTGCRPSCGAGLYFTNCGDACATIPAGRYTVPGTTVRTYTCPEGTFNPLPGCTEACACCRTCPWGSSSPPLTGDSVGATACAECAPGSWWSEVTSTQPASMQPRVAQTGIQRITRGACTLCPAGTHTRVPIGNSSLDCVGCDPGSWAPAGKYGATCNLCPAGTASRAQNATTSGTCTPCPVGAYSDAGAVTCTTCPEGTVNPDTRGAGLAACLPCGDGTFSGRGAITCQACPAGLHCPAGLAIACPAGTANPNAQATSPSACVACSAGSSATDAGRAACTPDAPGAGGAGGVGAAAPPSAAAPETPWEHVQAWVLPILSLIGCAVTYVLFGDRAVSVCAPALHERAWRGYAGCLAGSVAPCCCCVRGRAATMSSAAGVLRRLEAMKAERAEHAAAVAALMLKHDAGAGKTEAAAPTEAPLPQQTMVNPIRTARSAAAATA